MFSHNGNYSLSKKSIYCSKKNEKNRTAVSGYVEGICVKDDNDTKNSSCVYDQIFYSKQHLI